MTTATAVRAPKVPAVFLAGPLTGTGTLAKLALRRDRIMLPAWVYVVVGGVAANAYTFTKLYKTESSRAALALAIGTCGLAFTAVSAVAAQLTAGARAARGLAIGVLGVAFLARAVGDSAGAGGPGWLTWVLPLGWTETLRPFAGERWWVLALFGAAAWLSFALAAGRDHGAGLFPDRPGRPAASGALRGPLALAGRLQWPALAGWAAGYAVLFAVCGAAAKGIGQLVGTSGTLDQEFTRLGGQAEIVNAYLAALMLPGGPVSAAPLAWLSVIALVLGATGLAALRHRDIG